jgi:hypothetical protein
MSERKREELPGFFVYSKITSSSLDWFSMSSRSPGSVLDSSSGSVLFDLDRVKWLNSVDVCPGATCHRSEAGYVLEVTTHQPWLSISFAFVSRRTYIP